MTSTDYQPTLSYRLHAIKEHTLQQKRHPCHSKSSMYYVTAINEKGSHGWISRCLSTGNSHEKNYEIFFIHFLEIFSILQTWLVCIVGVQLRPYSASVRFTHISDYIEPICHLAPPANLCSRVGEWWKKWRPPTGWSVLCSYRSGSSSQPFK